MTDNTRALPFAHTVGVYAGRFIVEPIDRATVIHEGIALYLHPPTPAWHDAPETIALKAERDELLEVLNRLVTERHAGLASKEAWDDARAAIAKPEGSTA